MKKAVALGFLAVTNFAQVALSADSSAAEYQGSTFHEVVDVLNDRGFAPRTEVERREFEVYRSGALPQYEMSRKVVFPGGDSAPLERDAKRTINERFDYYDRLPKRLHPNGVCVTGEWVIDRESPYSGYFKKDARALFVGRVSVAMQETTTAGKRGFGVAGKIFPTTDRNAKVATANFFTVDVLLGTKTKRFLDAPLTNEPPVGEKIIDSVLNFMFAKALSDALSAADKNPLFRPVAPIAKLGEADPAQAKFPKWIRLTADSATAKNNEVDFRNEVVKAVQANGTLKLNIEVSDTTKDRTATSGWTPVGQLKLDSAIVSYGCDRRLHFAHPKLND